MAPPSPRRPGFSRRAQYGIFISYVIAIVGAGLGLLLALTARFDPEGHARLQGVITDLTSPVSSAVRSVIDGGGEGADSVGAYFNAASKNKAMTAEVRAARTKLIEGQAAALDNARLKRLMGIIESDGRPIAAARIVASSGSSSRRFATLAAGRAQGIANGQPVRGPDGLIGRVVQVGNNASRVLLIVDGGNVVPVKRVSDGLPALAIGLGNGMLEIKPLAAASNPFQVKDVFVASGSGGIYRPGVPVALGIRKTREAMIGRPIADPARLDFAIVEPVFVAPLPPPPETAP